MSMNVSGLVLCGFLFAVVSCASKPREMDKKAQLHFNAGTQSLMNQEYTDALSNLLKANAIEKNNPEILNNLGMAYFFRGDSALALKCLTEALELDPKNSDAKVNIASIHFKEGNTGAAEALYKEVLRDLTYDKQARTYYNLGIIELEKRQNLSAAEGYFKASLKESEDYCPAHYKLGVVYLSRKESNKAYQSFRDATMGTCLNSANAHYGQALALIELRRYTDARLKLDEIETKFPKTVISVKARTKLLELDEIERQSPETHARTPRKAFQSPEF